MSGTTGRLQRETYCLRTPKQKRSSSPHLPPASQAPARGVNSCTTTHPRHSWDELYTGGLKGPSSEGCPQTVLGRGCKEVMGPANDIHKESTNLRT